MSQTKKKRKTALQLREEEIAAMTQPTNKPNTHRPQLTSGSTSDPVDPLIGQREPGSLMPSARKGPHHRATVDAAKAHKFIVLLKNISTVVGELIPLIEAGKPIPKSYAQTLEAWPEKLAELADVSTAEDLSDISVSRRCQGHWLSEAQTQLISRMARVAAAKTKVMMRVVESMVECKR